MNQDVNGDGKHLQVASSSGLEDNVLRFEVAVDQLHPVEDVQRQHDRAGKCAHRPETKTLEPVPLDLLKKIVNFCQCHF